MNAAALFNRWLDLLAGLVSEWREQLQSRKSVIVTQEDGYFALRRSSDLQTAFAHVPMGARPTADTMEALRDQFIVFELAAHKIVVRRITVPLQAQEFLQGIVRNQIERLSPWPPAQSLYAIDAKPSEDSAQTLNVSVFIASRASIDALRDELAESGLGPQRIAVQTGSGGISPLVLWTRPAEKPQQTIQNLPRMIGIGMAAAVVLSLTVSLWAAFSTSSISADRDDVADRIQALEKRGSARNTNLAALNPPERAWALKENAPVAVLILEYLSRALPDSAYLTELHLENATLRIIGLASDAPSLIGDLEKSGRFSQVHFFAPTTKGQGTQLYKFFIETRVEEHPDTIGD